MTTPHTPGPWRLSYGKRFEYDYLLKAGKDTPIAYWSNFKIRTKKESKANARLIAAAPDLLQALQEVMPMLEIRGEPEPGSIGRKARAAISKAIGS